ncbi:MAG TPA: hypothetical protein VNL73_00285 [Verrucomicrobiae bacterium]|nr:hypothetical protein [Verrucomicrobiae bacterium]
MFAQRAAEAFDLTNRRLVYPLLFFFLGLPVVGIMLSAGQFQDPATATPGLVLKFFGYFLLYALLALFVWPFAYGGVIGELAHFSGGATDWGLFKTWAVKSYGRLLLFNLLLLFLLAVLLFLVVVVMVFGFLATSIGSGDISALEEQLSQPPSDTGLGLFFGEFFSTLLAEAFILIIVAAMLALVLTDKGLWSSLGAGFKIFFSRPVFKLYWVAFMLFFFLNLLGALVFNRPGMPRLFSGTYFVILVLMQSYFSVFAIAYLLPAFKPKVETEISYAPTG